MWAILRLLRASWLFGWILCSYLFQLGLERLLGKSRTQKRWQLVHRCNAKRLYKGFVRLRGVYIKLGQILSVMGTFLPIAYVEELESLQDEVPPRPYHEIKKAIILSLGKRPDELFKEFSPTPIAAASLGQVHQGLTFDGKKIAVKVLYPNVATIIKIDLRVLGWAIAVYRLFVPIRQIKNVHTQLKDMLERETDLEHEAVCLDKMRENFQDDPDVLLPRYYSALSNKTVLTMSFMEGKKITNKAELEKMGISPDDVAKKLVKVFYKQLFSDRFFHADPHPGNFFVQKGEGSQIRLVILDLGSATSVPESLVYGMLDILTGVMTSKDDLVVRGIETMGFVAHDGNHELLEKAVRTYFEKLMSLDIKDFSKISPQLAKDLATPGVRKDQLRELMKSVNYPDGWFYVERAMVMLFGLSVQLAPTVNAIQVGFPYVMKVLAEKNAAMKESPLESLASNSSGAKDDLVTRIRLN